MNKKCFLGVTTSKRKSLQFRHLLKRGEVCIEEGNLVYAVSELEFFCHVCDGCGCKLCKWTGEESYREYRKKQQ